MSNSERIPPNRQALTEAFALSAEILRNIELSELPLVNIALKTSRLARLLNDFDFQKIMEFEVSGYPYTPDGIVPEVWRLGVIAGRRHSEKDSKTGDVKEYIYTESISQWEEELRLAEVALSAARDPDISVSSANPNQYVNAGIINRQERLAIRGAISSVSKKISSRRSVIYQYVLRRHYELKYSGVADDIFTRIRERVDAEIGKLIPDAVQRFTAVYENLRSDNPEDWSNAVHSCRRILQDVADVIFPPTEVTRSKTIDGKAIKIKLGREQYINRIIAFVEDNIASDRYSEVVGSELAFLGDRLDSIFHAAQKGSHSTIVSREEADRYVVSTYLLVGDILSLMPSGMASMKI